MTATIPITVLIVSSRDLGPVEIDLWLAANCPTGALVLQEPGQVAPRLAAAVCPVPPDKWFTLPTCLCCMAPDDPRLILLRATDDHEGMFDAPIRHILISLAQPALETIVLRTLSTLSPLGPSFVEVRTGELV